MTGRGKIAAALLGLLLGLGLGLLAGWVLWPAEYDSIAPDLLPAAYQTDYANMIAANYARTADLDSARAQLARLGPSASDILRRAAADDPAAARLLADLDAAPATNATPQPAPTPTAD
jgi:hypothetical protein